MSVRYVGVGVALLGALVVLSGCGVSQVIDPVAAAASRSANAGGAKVTMSVSITMPLLPAPLKMSATGLVDDSSADITVDQTELGAISPLLASTVEIRYLEVDGNPAIYQRSLGIAGQASSAKPWIELPSEVVGGEVKALGSMQSLLAANPGGIVDLLRATGSVQQVGSETIDGVATTHYSATIDLVKAAHLRSTAEAESVKQAIEVGLSPDLPVDVWIGNDDGLVHQVTVDAKESIAGSSFEISGTLGISDYGTPVTVVAPPADEVASVSSHSSGSVYLAMPSSPQTTQVSGSAPAGKQRCEAHKLACPSNATGHPKKKTRIQH